MNVPSGGERTRKKRKNMKELENKFKRKEMKRDEKR